MMKKLIFLRHAKSQWYSPDGFSSDRVRPIKQKGANRMKMLLKHYSHHFSEVDKVFSSPAKRASQTAELLVRGLKLNFNLLEIAESLYTFSDQPIIDFIYQLDNYFAKVVLVGHNPGFESCINQLGDLSVGHLPTASFGLVSFEQESWREIGNGKTIMVLPGQLEQ